MSWIVLIDKQETECTDEAQAERFAELHRPYKDPITYEKEEEDE